MSVTVGAGGVDFILVFFLVDGVGVGDNEETEGEFEEEDVYLVVAVGEGVSVSVEYLESEPDCVWIFKCLVLFDGTGGVTRAR